MRRLIRTLVEAFRRPKFAEGGVLPLSRSPQLPPSALLGESGVDYYYWFPKRGWVKVSLPVAKGVDDG